jgi:hypothetical protein
MAVAFDLLIALGLFLIALSIVSHSPDTTRQRLVAAATQFSIRDLLWFVVVMSLVAFVYRERLSLTDQRRFDERRLADHLEALAVKEKEVQVELARLRTVQKEVAEIDKLREENSYLKARLKSEPGDLYEDRPGYRYEAKPGQYFLAPVR